MDNDYGEMSETSHALISESRWNSSPSQGYTITTDKRTRQYQARFELIGHKRVSQARTSLHSMEYLLSLPMKSRIHDSF